METAIFDKAVKEQIPEWIGYRKYHYTIIPDILSRVDSLDMSNSELLIIPKELINCKNLLHINLFGNTNIDWSSIKHINPSKIKSIYVSLSNVDKINNGYRNKITGLEILEQDLSSFPKNILHLDRLRILDMRGKIRASNLNDDDNFKGLFSKLIFLDYLDLSDCKVGKLPKSISNLKSLRYLYLSKNSLQQIPSEIGLVDNLKYLLLTSNNLKYLPKEIKKLRKLELLDLRGNPIPKEEQEKIRKLLPNCEIKF